MFGVSAAVAQGSPGRSDHRVHRIRHIRWLAAAAAESQVADDGAALLQTDYERSWVPYPRSPITGLPMSPIYNTPTSGPCLEVPGIRLMRLGGDRH
jgi:hypothetical protein